MLKNSLFPDLCIQQWVDNKVPHIWLSDAAAVLALILPAPALGCVQCTVTLLSNGATKCVRGSAARLKAIEHQHRVDVHSMCLCTSYSLGLHVSFMPGLRDACLHCCRGRRYESR